MSEPNLIEIERARQLLAFEGAALRVYDKIHTHLTPLIGAPGVELLLVRSAKLTKREFAWIAEVSLLAGSTRLREHLETADPPIDAATIEILFATFFSLAATLIGELLTMQALRSAWPTLIENHQR